jgi:hypothetical protein
MVTRVKVLLAFSFVAVSLLAVALLAVPGLS